MLTNPQTNVILSFIREVKTMQVEIIGQSHDGRGIAKEEGKVIFVQGALPQEICEIEIVKSHQKYEEAKVLQKIKSCSVLPSCSYYGVCGGCHLLHQSNEEQLRFKENKVREIFAKFSGVEVKINPILHGPQFSYRNKITFHDLGMYQKESRDLVRIEQCQLISERMNEVLHRLKKYQQDTQEVFHQVMIRESNCDDMMLDIEGSVSSCQFFQEFSDISCIFINGKCLTSRRKIRDKINGLTFFISRKSFYQVNRYMTEVLYQEVIRHFEQSQVKNVLDLYCGVGTLSLLVSPYVDTVIGVEVIEEAVKNAKENRDFNHISNCQFICGKVEDFIDTFENIDAIIVDPPRAGLDKKTRSTVFSILPKLIVYVSCDAVTLARDVGVLKEKYEVQSLTPVEMFPNSYHVECVCVLNRR